MFCVHFIIWPQIGCFLLCHAHNRGFIYLLTIFYSCASVIFVFLPADAMPKMCSYFILFLSFFFLTKALLCDKPKSLGATKKEREQEQNSWKWKVLSFSITLKGTIRKIDLLFMLNTKNKVRLFFLFYLRAFISWIIFSFFFFVVKSHSNFQLFAFYFIFYIFFCSLLILWTLISLVFQHPTPNHCHTK